MRKKNSFRKRRAIYLLTACQQDVESVARDLCVTKATVNKWLKDKDFQEQLEKSMQRIELYDSKYRAKQNKIIGDRFYEEVHRRISTTRELQDLPLSTLLTKLKELNNEIRVDTPGDATSRGEVSHKHEIIDGIIERYKKIKNEQQTLKLVELPEKKEGTNG